MVGLRTAVQLTYRLCRGRREEGAGQLRGGDDRRAVRCDDRSKWAHRGLLQTRFPPGPRSSAFSRGI